MHCLRHDKKNRYGKADAYRSGFFAVLGKKIAFEADTVLRPPWGLHVCYARL